MYKFKSFCQSIIADKTSPIEIYLKLRNIFVNILLLESYSFQENIQQNNKNNFSIICLEVIAEIIMDNDYIYYRYPDKCEEKISLTETEKIKNGCEILENFMKQFYSENKYFKISGFYGYISYDSIPYFEDIYLQAPSNKSYQIPKIRFALYKNILSFNSFNSIISIYLHNFINNEINSITEIISFLSLFIDDNKIFQPIKRLSSNLTDNGYKKLVSKSIKACKSGDIFQIVISRQFQQKFKGDEFNLYRQLRSINPSPFLFYFDYIDYKIFGSSPEYQLIIINNTAYLYPIAGTILRSGDYFKDKMLSEELSKNTKENSEHVMLVDLSRNDLSRNSSLVKIEKLKDIKYFSHVIHLESKISGILPKHFSPIKVFAECFPAGTLSGAPKYKAIKLIDEFENQSRGVYGGSIGFFGLDGCVNTAIIIRSFLSKGNTLFMQAGAGIVANSTEENELQEVNNKLKALNKAILTSKNFL